MPATTRSGSEYERAIARTWEVQGLGGKLQVGAEGSFLMSSSSRQEPPPSRLMKRAEGSVPAKMAPSAGEMTTAVILGCSIPESSCQLAPPSSLLKRPSSEVPM